MIPKRKLKTFLVTPDQIALPMKSATSPDRPLPEDAELVFGHWDATLAAFRLTFHSEAFDEVLVGGHIPLSMNGPTLLEAPK